jgi:hypothetical protein
MALKTALTFEEKVTAAYLHHAQGVDQHVIAMAMGVIMGRVNEACVAVRKALTPGSAPGNVTQLKEKRA